MIINHQSQESNIDRYNILDSVKQEAVSIRLEHEVMVTQRSTVLKSLEEAVKYEEDDPRIYHGRLFSSICLAEPALNEDDDLEDADNVVDHKLKYLSDLVKLSKRTLVFTEAVTNRDQHDHGLHYGAKQCGISHTHDTDDDHGHSVPLSYQHVSALARVGLVHAWVQLGHDGLPQEAGCPLPVREIYDSWRTQEHDCYREELETVDTEIRSSDLILVFGHSPSLSGETADQLSQIAHRDYAHLGQSLGLVIMSQHSTHLDKCATIRVNGDPDTNLGKLCHLLELESMEPVEIKTTVREACEEVTDVGSTKDDYAHGDDDVKEVACLDSSHRAFVADALTHFKEIDPEDPRIHHGRMLSETCLEAPDESDTGVFEDKDHTLDYKLEKMINLVRLSKKTVFCVCAVESDPVSCTLADNWSLQAKIKLRLLSFLKSHSLVEFVIQTGHDGVLQAAGVQPHQLLEIHDVSNISRDDRDKIELVLDNTDLVVFDGSSADDDIHKMIVDKVGTNSKSGVRYEIGCFS